MEMSAAYMEETARALESKGYELTTEEAVYGKEGSEEAATATRYVLKRDPHQHFVLEVVRHPEVHERYYLEIVTYFGMRAYSFLLDSWKHRPDRVEFKFYALPETSMGLSFILNFDAIPVMQ